MSTHFYSYKNLIWLKILSMSFRLEVSCTCWIICFLSFAFFFYCSSAKCLIMDWRWHKDHCIAGDVNSAPTERPNRDVNLLLEANMKISILCTRLTKNGEPFLKLRICLGRGKKMWSGVGYEHALIDDFQYTIENC